MKIINYKDIDKDFFSKIEFENIESVNEIISKLQEMKLLEHKGKGFEPIQTRDDLTDALHAFLGINTDTEIITYKKIKNFLSLK